MDGNHTRTEIGVQNLGANVSTPCEGGHVGDMRENLGRILNSCVCVTAPLLLLEWPQLCPAHGNTQIFHGEAERISNGCVQEIIACLRIEEEMEGRGQKRGAHFRACQRNRQFDIQKAFHRAVRQSRRIKIQPKLPKNFGTFLPTADVANLFCNQTTAP